MKQECIVNVEHDVTHDGKHVYFVYVFDKFDNVAYTTEEAGRMVQEILERVNHKKERV